MVDDDQDRSRRMAVARTLGNAGYEVCIDSAPSPTVSTAVPENPALVFLDIRVSIRRSCLTGRLGSASAVWERR